jgi:hypothetical protein
VFHAQVERLMCVLRTLQNQIDSALVAYGIFCIGILCNLVFYSDFGNGFSSLVYAIIGLLFDLSKVASIVLFVYFVRVFERNLTATTICAMVRFVLSLLSLAAAYGFFSQLNETYEAMRLKDSAIYAQHKQAVDNAQAKLDSLAQYAHVDTAAITAQIASYQGANDSFFNSVAKNSLGQSTGRTVGQLTAQCTKDNWYTRHYCGKRLDNHAQIQQLQAQLQGYQQYQSALAHHKKAQNAFHELAIVGAANQAHPLFVNVGRLTNNSASDVKGFFILLTSLVVELLGSVLMFMLSKVVLGPLSTLTPPINTTAFVPPTSIQTRSIPTRFTDNTTQALLEQVTNDIATGELTSLSFRTLQRKYQIGQSAAQFIRQAMIREGLAQMDEASHQLRLTVRPDK